MLQILSCTEDCVTTTFEYLKTLKFLLNPNLWQNEREVESKLIVSYLLPELGYDINSWQQEVKHNRLRLDFLVHVNGSKTNSAIIIEAKHPRKQLRDGIFQLKNYMLKWQVNYGVLTNGHEFMIYHRYSNTNMDLVFECQITDIEQQMDKIKSLIGKEHIDTSNPPQVQQVKRHHKMKVIAIFHNKGGVGKTTTTVNLADAIARTGKKVLIIDVDSQANATFATGLMNFSDEATDNIKDKYVYHMLESLDNYPIHEVVRKARYTDQDIDVIPSHLQLMKMETDLNTLPTTNFMMRRKLEASTKAYDVVLIDTPPSLNLYAQISLIASDYLLIPSDLKVFANEGLENVKGMIGKTIEFQKMFNLPHIKVLGVLPTKILNNPGYIRNLKTQRIPKIEATYGFKILQDLMITERNDLAKCFDDHVEVGDLDIPDPKSIFMFNPTSPSVGEFQALAKYVLAQIGL